MEVMTTEGGFEYITKTVGEAGNLTELKIRNSHEPGRLTEDGETFEEYKTRRRLGQNYIKQHAKGQYLWYSKKLPELEDFKDDESVANYVNKNMGTYNKEVVLNQLKQLEEDARISRKHGSEQSENEGEQKTDASTDATDVSTDG